METFLTPIYGQSANGGKYWFYRVNMVGAVGIEPATSPV
jgi:hypothetical protein